jgi:ubiquinone/menaquinone biosynthesis C-methylase UbiE
MEPAFDRLAARYDELWTLTTTGRLQREAVWRHITPLFRAGENILDMGCGTGEDALRLERRGVHVRAIDASPAMVQIARQQGVAASVLMLEDLEQLEGNFDGALSNFGALNCVANPADLRGPLGRLIRPGGFLALCIMGRFCLWESAHFLARAEFRKSARRWSGASVSTPLGIRVNYPTARRLCRALRPYFTLVRSAGIGVFVPPSFVSALSDATLKACAAMDYRVAHLPGVRTLSDHRLLVFRRC